MDARWVGRHNRDAGQPAGSEQGEKVRPVHGAFPVCRVQIGEADGVPFRLELPGGHHPERVRQRGRVGWADTIRMFNGRFLADSKWVIW